MNFIKFLGTAGARVAVAKQLRASGGIWLSLDNTNILIDPGPGSLVRCLTAQPGLDPTKLNGIVLSHKHLDHAADINVMIEAMTVGGKERRGVVLAPADAIAGEDPIIYKYLRAYPQEIITLAEKKDYPIGKLTVRTTQEQLHGVQTYGFVIKGKKRSISYIADTKFYPGLVGQYDNDVVIINMLLPERLPYQHLCVDDVRTIICDLKPRQTILTHFGGALIKAGPEKIAARLSRELKHEISAAEDGLLFSLT